LRASEPAGEILSPRLLRAKDLDRETVLPGNQRSRHVGALSGLSYTGGAFSSGGI